MNPNNHVILCGNNRPGISSNILSSVFNVPKKTIDNEISKLKNGHSTRWSFVEHAKVKFFVSIPLRTRNRYSIPRFYEDIIERVKSSEIEKAIGENNEAILLSELKHYCDENWPRLITNYNQSFLKMHERESLAYIEAALLFVIAKESLGVELYNL